MPGAGQNGAVLPDRDQVAVGEAIHIVDGIPGAARDLRPTGAAVDRLDDEAGAVAEIARQRVGEGWRGAAQKAGLESWRGEGLHPRLARVRGVVHVARAVGTDHGLRVRHGKGEGRGEGARIDHLAEVGPGLAGVRGPEETVVVVRVGAGPAPRQHDVGRDRNETASTVGRCAGGPGDTAVRRTHEGTVHDAHCNRAPRGRPRAFASPACTWVNVAPPSVVR